MSEHVHQKWNASNTDSFPCPDCVTRNEETARLREVAAAWREYAEALVSYGEDLSVEGWRERRNSTRARLIELGEVKE